ncbi:MAG: hypothetical protein GY851_03815 [bacterium]|nr:hypothetical protein [bacterium]
MVSLGEHLASWQRDTVDESPRALLAAEALTILGDATRTPARYPFPDAFAQRLRGGRYAAGPLRGDLGSRHGWVFFDSEPHAIYLIGVPDGAAPPQASVERVPLPDSYLLVTFMAGEDRAPRLLALGEDGIDEVSLRASALGEVTPLARPGQLMDRELLGDVAHDVVDWTLDVDGDGLEDLLVFATTSAEVYLQEPDGELSHTGPITCGDRTLLWTSSYATTHATFPIRGFTSDETWMEPVVELPFPDLVVSQYIYAQTARGVFDEAQWLELVEDLRPGVGYALMFRHVTECRVSATREPGVAVIQSIWKDTTAEASVQWSNRGDVMPPLTFDRCMIPPRLTDIDKDGISEVFAIDVPPLRKAIDMVLKMGFGSVELSGRFLAVQKDGKSWAQVSRSVSMQVSCWDFAEQFGHFYDKFRTLEKVLLADVDIDGDGTGDLVWPSADGEVTVLFLESRKGRIRPKDRVEIPVASNVLSLTPVDAGQGDGTAILVESVPEGAEGFDEDEWMPRAWHLVRWTD